MRNVIHLKWILGEPLVWLMNDLVKSSPVNEAFSSSVIEPVNEPVLETFG